MANVLELLEKINRSANKLGTTELSKLEYDLLMQQVRDLYDALDTLRHAKPAATPAVHQQIIVEETVKPIAIVEQLPVVQQSVAPVVDTVIQVVEEAPVVEQIISKPVEKPIIEFIQEPVVEVKHEPIVHEPVRQEPIVVKQQPVTEQKPVYTEPVAVLEEEPILISHTPITDKVEQAVPINERIKGAADLNERWKGATTEIHQRFAMKPMKEMIDLNRRIAFVNDLFRGDADALNKAVQAIDNANDYEVAKAYVNNLARTLSWYESSQSAKLFVKLVKQRFGEE